MLQSPDGNWIALQTSQHSRPSLLTKRKSLVFSVLEKESGVVSAYDEMGSESEDGAECDNWELALLQFRQRLSEETRSSDTQHDKELCTPIILPSSGHITNSDSENSVAPPIRECIPVHSVTKINKASPEPYHPYMPYESHRPAFRPSHLPRFGVLDVNLNPQMVGDSSEGDEQAEQIQRLWRRKRNKQESAEQSCVHKASYKQVREPAIFHTCHTISLSTISGFGKIKHFSSFLCTRKNVGMIVHGNQTYMINAMYRS